MTEPELLAHFAPFLPRPTEPVTPPSLASLGVDRPRMDMRMPSLESCRSDASSDSPMPVTPRRPSRSAVLAQAELARVCDRKASVASVPYLPSPARSPTVNNAVRRASAASPRHVRTRAGVRQRISPPSSCDMEAPAFASSAALDAVVHAPAPVAVAESSVPHGPKRKLSRGVLNIPASLRRSSVPALDAAAQQLGLPFTADELHKRTELRSQRSSNGLASVVRGYFGSASRPEPMVVDA